jgi:hypothetical protein
VGGIATATGRRDEDTRSGGDSWVRWAREPELAGIAIAELKIPLDAAYGVAS